MKDKTTRFAPIAASLMVAGVFAAQTDTAVPFPDGYRSWQHVKSIVVSATHKSFSTRGGIHHYYANEKAAEGYRTGTFANGAVIVDENVFATEGDGPSTGILLEGRRRALDVMIKNDEWYTATGGWGFEHFNGDDRIGTLDAGRKQQCYACHATSRNGDHVFSRIRP